MKTPAQELQYQQAMKRAMFDTVIVLLVYSPWLTGFADILNVVIDGKQLTPIYWTSWSGVFILLAPIACIFFLYITRQVFRYFHKK